MTSVKKVKVALLALVAALVIAIPTSAFADTITINGTATGHEYEAYQIFKADLAEDGKTVSNVKWGDNIKSADFVSALKTAGIIGADVSEPGAVAEALESADGEALADIIGKNLKDDPVAFTEGDDMVYTATVNSGYYFVKDKDGSVNGENDAYTDFILKVAGVATATPKSTWPEVDKSVREDSGTTYADAGDFEVGQAIDYRITAKIPSGKNFQVYKKYYVNFIDTMDAGLEYIANSAKVTLAGNDITDKFDIKFENQVLTITAKPGTDGAFLRNVPGIEGGTIQVDYQAVITKDAVVYGTPGYTNDVYMQFSNNPNQDADGKPGDTGETPKDYCVVFTYIADQTKIDGDTDQPLKGAGFVLQREDGMYYTDTFNENGTRVWTSNIEEAVVRTSATGTGKFDFKGLDEGKYTLIEKVVPDGYNKVADIPFEIKSTVKYDDDDKYAGKDSATDGPTTVLTGLEIIVGTEDAVAGNTENGTVSQTVENMPGNTLPSTGGIGTTIFTIVGIALIVAAAAIMVVRRRNAAALQ